MQSRDKGIHFSEMFQPLCQSRRLFRLKRLTAIYVSPGYVIAHQHPRSAVQQRPDVVGLHHLLACISAACLLLGGTAGQ